MKVTIFFDIYDQHSKYKTDYFLQNSPQQLLQHLPCSVETGAQLAGCFVPAQKVKKKLKKAEKMFEKSFKKLEES